MLSIFAFMFTQYTSSCTKSLVFLYPCSCCVTAVVSASAFFYPSLGCNLSLPSFHIGQYCLMPCSTSFFCDQPCIIYVFTFCRWVSSHVANCMSSMDVHTEIFNDVLMALTFIIIPAISWSLFFVWLFQDSQSTTYRSGPGLYMMYTLYWCILSTTHCNH